MQKRGKRYLWGIFCVCIILLSPIVTMKAASALKISYNGTNVNYTKARVKFSVNGKNIGLSGTPGILINNNSMGYYVSVFKKGLHADCVYDSSKKTLTITKFNNTVVLKQNSRTAYVNGKKKTMDVPMLKVKYKAKGVSRMMVPVSFVAKNLGYTYTWNKSTKTGMIKYNWLELNRGEQWEKYTGTQVKTSFNGEKIDSGAMPGMIVNGTAFLNGKAIFESGLGGTCVYDSTNETITVSENDVTIVYTVGSTTALVNGVSQTMANPPFRVKNRATGKYYCMVPGQFTATALGYYYHWNGKTKTSEITDVQAETEELEENKEDTNSTISGAAITFSLPAANVSAVLTNEDLYYQNQFVIKIPVDCVSYLESNPPVIANANVKDYEISLSSQGETEITFTTTKLQGYRVHNDNGLVRIEVGEPKEIYKNIVVLDCGHGGSDPGAQGGGYNEKDLTYNILYCAAKPYFDSVSSNIKVYWSRYDDTFVTLSDRAAYASKVGADLFVSLHMNSATNTAAAGTEVYYATNNNATLSSGISSKKMASALLESLLPVMGTKNRGVKTAGYAVIKNNTVPAVLIELGFISNAGDRSKITDGTYQQNAAKSIYDTLEQLFATYPTGR